MEQDSGGAHARPGVAQVSARCLRCGVGRPSARVLAKQKERLRQQRMPQPQAGRGRPSEPLRPSPSSGGAREITEESNISSITDDEGVEGRIRTIEQFMMEEASLRQPDPTSHMASPL
jgi:hypothetical protein